ncbi:MAG: hypothetical protein ACJA2S_001070 [Cyclobacteriaceae bacterium]|jgi:hypothetical protein
MFYLIYTSQQGSPISNKMLRDILLKSKSRNKACNVTGILIRIEDRFIQLLEGEEEDVEKIYSSICRDIRHHHISKVLTGYRSERLFRDWAMAFSSPSKEQFAEVTELKNIKDIEKVVNINDDSHPALIVMNHFNKRYQRD